MELNCPGTPRYGVDNIDLRYAKQLADIVERKAMSKFLPGMGVVFSCCERACSYSLSLLSARIDSLDRHCVESWNRGRVAVWLYRRLWMPNQELHAGSQVLRLGVSEAAGVFG